MKEKILKYKKPILLIVIVLIIFSITMYTDSNNEIKTKSKESLESIKVEETTIKTSSGKVYVDIKGAVKKPGVYEIESNYRVIDQTTPNMIQRISGILERNPSISKEI